LATNDPTPGTQIGEVTETPWTVRSLTTAGILTDAIRLMRSDFWRLCGIVGILVIPANVGMGLLVYLMMRHMGQVPYMDPDQAVLGMIFYALLLVGAISVWGLVVPFAQIALMRGIHDRYLGQPVRIGKAYQWMVANFWLVAGTVVLWSLVVFAGMLMFILPGIVALFLLMYTVPVVVTEGRGGFYALQRSVALVTKQPGKLLMLVLYTYLLSVAISSIPQLLMPQPEMQGPPGSTDAMFAYYNDSALVTGLTMAIAGFTQTVIRVLRGSVYLLTYFDTRCRSEGYDVQFAAEKAGVWGSAPIESEAPGG